MPAAEKKSGRGKKKKDGSQNRKGTPRAKSNGRGKGDDAPQGLCFSLWRTGSCSTQGFKYEHRANPQKGKAGKGGSRGSSAGSNQPM